MIVNLIKPNQMYSLALPNKVKGQYWLMDLNENSFSSRLIGIEAIDEKWVLKSNAKVRIFDTEGKEQDNWYLSPASFLLLKPVGSDENFILFTEPIDSTRQILTRIIAKEPAIFTIGRAKNNNFCFNNTYVSSLHAKLTFDGEAWSISDCNSRNGIYVNRKRVVSQKLFSGDYIYIMGLKIIIGSNYIAVNNPDEKLSVRSESLILGQPQRIIDNTIKIEPPERKYYFRSPIFHREIEHKTINIESPPQPEKEDTVPLALMLGPSLTMGLTSLSSGVFSVINATQTGNISSALPTMIMSLSMLLGTALWPILTKRYEKIKHIETENKRQKKYLDYLSEIGSKIKNLEREQCEILRENFVSPEECADRILREKSSLWERMPGQDDFLRLRLGLGSKSMYADVTYQERKFTLNDDVLQDAMLALAEEPKILNDVPIDISLIENIAVGIYGEKVKTDGFVQSLLLQMISLHSYDELKIMIIVDDEEKEKWQFAKYIPHIWSDDKNIRFFASNNDEVKEISSYLESNVLVRPDGEHQKYTEFAPYFVVISLSKKLYKSCEVLTKLIRYKSNVGFSALFIGEKFNDFPKETKTVINVNGKVSKIFSRDNTCGIQTIFDAENINNLPFNLISQKLANIELAQSTHQYTMPSILTFLEMFNVGKVEYLNSLTRWKDNNPTKSLRTPVGVNEDGDVFDIDLHEKYHGPHGLVAGMTGSGKSEFIITYILSLAVNYHPDEVAFILIDYKGGGLASAFENDEKNVKLPHLAGTITNLDGASIKRSLVSIQSELRRRQNIFNEALKVTNEGTMDIYKYQQLYRDKVVNQPLPHLFIISDEFAELKTQQPEFMEQLISAARIGRSLGVHLILATQKPSGVVDDQIWSNSRFRVCLKVQERADSQDMIKCPDAAELTQTGRFFLQVGYNEFFALGQSAWCGADYIPTNAVEKSVDSTIQVIDNIGRVVMNVIPPQKKEVEKAKSKQIVSVVKYLSDLAKEEHIAVKPLWLAPIPKYIYADALVRKFGNRSQGIHLEPTIGEYDDPFNQKQDLLTLPVSDEGNCLLYGSAGSGKTTFLTTVCYSLIKNHNASELNIYVMDFGSETLKMFEKAPQVGDFISSADEEKTVNLLKMLQSEMNMRRSLFSNYGGDYTSYCASSGKTLPNIVVIINNYSGFVEQYEDIQDDFSLLSRDGVKYGIYFIVTANSTNAVGYKIQQNFKVMMTLQLNDQSDYPIIIGKTDGLIPSAYKGRGLVMLDKVYEFQTAYCCDEKNVRNYIIDFCNEKAGQAEVFARKVPVLPDRVDFGFVSNQIDKLNRIPVGVEKKSLNILSVKLSDKVLLPVLAQDINDSISFAEELSKVISTAVQTEIIDSMALLKTANKNESPFDNVVKQIFDDMVNRNNTYYDADMSLNSLSSFSEKVYFIFGYKKFFDSLTSDSKDKMNVLLEKAESYYKLHFVIFDSVNNIITQNSNGWYKRFVSGSDGIWISDGFADQYVLKTGKLSREIYEEIGSNYGYVISKNKQSFVKLLTSEEGEG